MTAAATPPPMADLFLFDVSAVVGFPRSGLSFCVVLSSSPPVSVFAGLGVSAETASSPAGSAATGGLAPVGITSVTVRVGAAATAPGAAGSASSTDSSSPTSCTTPRP